ncbi:hypothetical protein M446_1944 [Methylobacterium sp. 4-46]|uniref:hypothetical protein n=1 Tax=unclassified Methylobacterium TaxID=2615210 RepID=UPI000152DA7D|nr:MULTISPECIES: hypothetical protein [Methylobacterium]ACA16412.1 hypothetical protein M446_1944 [Methylobacterium sp. 4-46]WFT82123.1 hypothetical protein QA634_09870 [Methylobacterium nodulans]
MWWFFGFVAAFALAAIPRLRKLPFALGFVWLWICVSPTLALIYLVIGMAILIAMARRHLA